MKIFKFFESDGIIENQSVSCGVGLISVVQVKIEISLN